MKFFLLFCAIYSVTLYADNPKKLDKAKQVITRAANHLDHGVQNSIKEVKKILKKNSAK